LTIEKLREVHKAQPFRPFELHMADGRSLRVDHPEFLATSPSGRTAVVYLPDDRLEIVDLLLVSSIGLGNGSPGEREARS
jgi:hypothetical protein